VGGVFDHLLHRPQFGQPSGIHHRDPVGGFGDHPHIVGDQHHRQAPVAAQPLEQRHDLGLDRDVERGGRFVGDHQIGFGAQRQRDHHPLAHPAREFVRIAADPVAGGGDADLFERRDRPFAGLGGGDVKVFEDRLAQLVADPQQRVERGQRVLKDHADAPAPDPAQRLARQGVDAQVAQLHAAPGDPRRRVEKADDGGAGHRLAGPRFAHHAEDLARGDVPADTIDGAQDAAPGGDFHGQVADGKDGIGHTISFLSGGGTVTPRFA
jgi:hypothetical protein